MSRRYGGIHTAIAATAAALAVTLSVADPAAAQRPGAGRQQGGFGQGRPGMTQRMGRPAPTLATTPVSAMVPYFGLTEEQAKKIEEIQKSARPNVDAIRAQVEELRNSVGDTSNGANRENMRARMMAMREEMTAQRRKEEENREKAVREIELVLTSEQRPAIASFLRDVELFENVNLPLELIRPLDLNGPQKRKLQQIAQQEQQAREQMIQQTISTFMQQNRGLIGPGNGQGGNAPIPNDPAARQQLGEQARQVGQQMGEAMRDAREKTREKALAVLTADQRAMVVQWEKDHPQAQRGFGPGGPGGRAAFGAFPGNGG